jgi:putative FmdB family regulatory protein
MPLYQYTCPTCDHAFEVLVFDGEAVECPQCHGREVKRQWGVPARARSASLSLPTGCDPDLPPCGPGCRRLPPG